MSTQPKRTLDAFFRPQVPTVQPISFSQSVATPPPPPTLQPLPTPPKSFYRPTGPSTPNAILPDRVLFEGGHIPSRIITGGQAHRTHQNQSRHRLKSCNSCHLPLRPSPPSYIQPFRWTKTEIKTMMDKVYPEWESSSACRALYYDHTTISSNNNSSSTHQPWAEKYSPANLDGMLANKQESIQLWDWLKYKKVSNRGRLVSEDLEMEHLTLMENEVDEHGFLTNAGFERFWGNPYEDQTKEKKPKLKSKQHGNDKKKTRPPETSLVLLVGPTGVGKTAAVYAAAKEIGYEVFEVHAGMRRSGKDIIAAVGAMTESHLVTFSKTGDKRRGEVSKPNLPNKRRVKPEPPAVPTNVGLMRHFARIKPIEKVAEEYIDVMHIDPIIDDAMDIVENEEEKYETNEPQEPKESLILLDQVDILYEEDKGFWSAVEELSDKSRRPIIMTCNDTSTIPIESLRLYGILHFESPPTEVLLPWLQLICFAEGFFVPPVDLVCLVAWVGDVRQIINTLQVWCPQFDLGDDISDEWKRDCTGLFGVYIEYELHEDDPLIRMYEEYQKHQIDSSLSSLKPFVPELEVSSSTTLDALWRSLEVASVQDAFMAHPNDPLQEEEKVWESSKDHPSGTGRLWDVPSDPNQLAQEIQTVLTRLARSVHGTHGAYGWEILEKNTKIRKENMLEACEPILPLRTIVQPRNSELLDYLPHIQIMCKRPSRPNSRNRTLRSRRYKPYLALSEESIEILTTSPPQQMTDMHQ
ncbi:hypothetical protein PHYBLDRAFT_64797 [Phycomyces blakesleeanus NRRL 1555(-)]|uniref:AAA+ ATPase domain-containing protein n=1 Tax=Phycomyces blakesleeanus (strain ATCC 8743b / DSM 1359 / FGSC 10004 / NBRC 33097 / NRRL 1555) TaxID=763407 RepID=A0A162U6J5_PHYB8|nr:hypothetical protein PHYBLDRAFT_64797 [Phycomyces blakesleeanus NRRL 1555(-)]OAD73842.1 hypothetical protein PHYBLDRAFT_64797 [Phycomyces blakesleeanus NRRL 1555(-)]|eukprot:XP_018291882.1 hypothetical protein PHYBLDRAFT_64797 [Phycomyces blakesleeanus NRRL 1555(-)]